MCGFVGNDVFCIWGNKNTSVDSQWKSHFTHHPNPHPSLNEANTAPLFPCDGRYDYWKKAERHWEVLLYIFAHVHMCSMSINLAWASLLKHTIPGVNQLFWLEVICSGGHLTIFKIYILLSQLEVASSLKVVNQRYCYKLSLVAHW